MTKHKGEKRGHCIRLTGDIYENAQNLFGRVCNNTLYGGDCYGSSYCFGDCDHQDVRCTKCQIVLCGHCLALRFLNKCPKCSTCFI